MDDAANQTRALDRLIREAYWLESDRLDAAIENTKPFRNQLHKLAGILRIAVQKVSCDRLYALYDQLIHKTTCETNEKGITWTFFSLLLMAFSGMVMLTFRCALYPCARDGHKANGSDSDPQPTANENDTEGSGIAGGRNDIDC